MSTSFLNLRRRIQNPECFLFCFYPFLNDTGILELFLTLGKPLVPSHLRVNIYATRSSMLSRCTGHRGSAPSVMSGMENSLKKATFIFTTVTISSNLLAPINSTLLIKRDYCSEIPVMKFVYSNVSSPLDVSIRMPSVPKFLPTLSTCSRP